MLRKSLLLLGIIKNYKNGFSIIYNVFLKKEGFMIVKMRNGTSFLIRCKSRDFHTINEVFLDNIYTNFMKEIKYTRGVILDLGQNIGCFSIKAARIFNQAKIIGFEPFESSCQMAKVNVMFNRLEERILCNQLAISSKKGSLDFYVYPGMYEGNSLNDIWGGNSKKIKVNSIKLADFIKKEKIKNIDLLKIDCEGAEYEIINSLSEGDYHKIKNIILEYHKGKSEEIENVLKNNGFKIHNLINSKDAGIIFAKKI